MEQREKRKLFTTIGKYSLVILCLILVVCVVKGFMAIDRFMRQTGITPGLIARLIIDDGLPLKSSDDRTNVLVLGIGGGTHEGADLTDTMQIVSIKHNPKSMAFISIPRDIWSETLKDKINSAYHYGELKKKGGGLVLSKVIVEDVVGMPIHYAILIDFSGFQEVIDRLGGVEVNVSKAFTDNEFPIAGKENDECDGDPLFKCRYESIHFDEGLQHMDGSRALKYIRSRHAEGEEGSDFARGRRQQEVLVALKEKIMRPREWFSFSRASELMRIVDDTTDTDMNVGELVSFGKRFARIKDAQIQHISFESELYDPPLSWYGRYVLIPSVDFETIKAYIKTQLHD
jgi:polyisoprenyl-teichoic acid--peptidoglycan teichoic acid transferase